MRIKAALNKLLDGATEAALAASLAIGFAGFAWHCIEEVWKNGGPYAAPATLLMACMGVLLVANSGGLAAAVMAAITQHDSSRSL